MNIGLQDERGYNQVFRAEGSTVTRRGRRMAWFASQALAARADHIVEIGCGYGETAEFVAEATGADVLAVDLSHAFVAQARARQRQPNVRYEVMDVLAPDASLGPCDFLYGNGILHHLLPNLVDVLSKLRRLMRPGGRMAFIEPNLAHPFCRVIFGTRVGRELARLEPQEMAFYGEDLLETCRAAGWDRVELVTGDLLLPGLPVWTIAPMLQLERLMGQRAQALFGQSHFVTATA
jgi:SAM-dependent methyltransferase